MGLGDVISELLGKRPKTGEGHLVTVYDVQAEGTPRYFVAICPCGWLGDTSWTHPSGAFEDAHKHSEHVNPEVELRT